MMTRIEIEYYEMEWRKGRGKHLTAYVKFGEKKRDNHGYEVWSHHLSITISPNGKSSNLWVDDERIPLKKKV